MAQNSTLYDVTGGGNGPSNVIEYTTVSGTISFGTPDAFYTYTGGSSSTTPIEFQAISLDAADGVYFVAAVVESNSNTSIYEEHFGATPSFTSAIATVTSTNYSVVENIGIDATDHTLFYADGVNVYSENFGSSFNNTPTVAKIAALPTPNATNDSSGGYASSMAYDQSEQAAYFGGATGQLTFTYTGPNHSGSKSYLIGSYYNNYIYKVSGVTKNATTAKTHVTTLVAVPLSDGVVTGMALDTANDTLVFVTQDGFTSGTNDVGVYSIALNNGGTPGAIKVIWQEATNSTSALGDSMDQITIDPVTGEYYISTNYGDSVSTYGANTIYEGNIASSAAPVAEYSTGSLTGSSGHAQPQGLAIDDAPTVSSVSVLSIDGNTGMTSGVIGVGDTLAIQVAFNENVTATGTPTLSLNDGGTASYVSGSGTADLVFSYKPASGQNTAGLAVTGLTGTVTDSAGTAANTSGASATFSGVRVDTSGPGLSVTASSTPAVQGGAAVIVLSAESISDPNGTGTLTGASVVIGSPVSGDVLGISGSLPGGMTSAYSNDTLSLSGMATAAQYATALGEVTYQDGGTGSATSRTLSFTVAEGTLSSAVATSSVAIDSPPTVSGVSVVSIDGNTGKTSGVIGAGDTLAIQVAFSKAVTVTGTPTLALNDGATASYVSGSGSANLVFNYLPASGQNVNGLAVTGLSGTLKDAAGAAANTSGATATFSGIRVDTTPPSLSVTGTSVEALQGGSALNVLSANPGITDPDGTGTLTGAKLVIANPQSGDALAINGSSSGSLDGGALSYSFANDTLSLSGTATEAQYQTALGEVTYQDTGTDTSTGAHPTRTLSFTVGEGTLTSSVATTVLTIDRSPSAIASVGASVAEGQQVTEGAGAALTGNSDPDGDALTITSVAQGATTLAAGNALTGTYGVLTLSANGGVTYNANDTAAINAAVDGAPPVDSFNFTISDGHGGTATETFDVTVNRPAVLSGATPPTTYTANDAPATVDSALTVADPDGTNLTGAQVAIGAGFLAGDVLTFTSTGGIGGNYNAATGVLTLSGSEAAADYQSALDSVQFYSTSADPTDGGTDDSRVINTTSEGPGGTSNAQPATVEVALCYLRGTRILTPTGEASIEDFKIGDHVVTRFSGIQPVKWIGRQSFAPEDRANWPIRIHAGALADGFPARDLFVSPGHSILLEGRLVLADLLVNGITIAREPPARRVDYYMLELGAHDCVIAEGAWAETYADAPGQRAQFINAAEYEALYPDEPPVQNLRLCAARPEGGKALNEVLRGVTARAGAGLAHGPLEGYVERVIEDWRITGWAFSLRHPQLPVLLEIHAAGRLLGSVLACDPRKDLAAAGKGSGRCAFTFQSPVRLKPEMLATLSLRRAADGEALPIDPQLQARPAAAARRLTLAG